MSYFDYAATCPLDSDAADAFIKASQHYFGNESSLHNKGGIAKELLEHCRQELANMLDVSSEGIYFTSGGSESNFLAIESLAHSLHEKGNHIISGMAEHSSIHYSLKRLEERGFEITYLPLNDEGFIDVAAFRAAIRKDTILATIQHANSEIGTIQPIHEISRLCRGHDILLHSDCVQTLGKCNLKELTEFADSFSLSSHKVYGPKGVGAVYINPNLPWKPIFPGATHERGFRPGTVNVPGIAGFIVALQKTEEMRVSKHKEYQLFRETLIQSLHSLESEVIIHGTNDERQLPSIMGLCVSGIEGQWIMLECNRKGYSISTGSACHTGQTAPSKTMTALGIRGKSAKELFRISFGRDTTLTEVEALGECLRKVIQEYQSAHRIS